MKKNTQKGFTLVELLVVIAILAILASVAVVGYTAFIDKAHQSNAETEAHQIQSAIENFTITGEYYILVDTDDTKYLVDGDDMLVYAFTVVNDEVVKGAVVKSVTTDFIENTVDFKDLPGELTIDANGNLVYTGNEADPITIK